MTAKIYRPSPSAAQSGQAKDSWVLEYEPEKAREIDPLMGWTSSSDMKAQVTLRFDSQEQAVAYAERHGIAYRIEVAKASTRKVISYSDNFRYNRLTPWSH